MIKKFTVVIEETVVDKFEVNAETEDAALEIAKEKYNKGEFVLEPGEVQYKQIAVMESIGENLEWNEF